MYTCMHEGARGLERSAFQSAVSPRAGGQLVNIPIIIISSSFFSIIIFIIIIIISPLAGQLVNNPIKEMILCTMRIAHW